MGFDSNALLKKCFPIDCYLRSIVRILDTIKYNDHNYTAQDRRDKLHYAYTKAAKHFAQPEQQSCIKDKPKRVQASVETCSRFVVYSFANFSDEVAADFTTLFAYLTLLDDTIDDPSDSMKNFFHNMQAGNPQTNVWWRLVNDQPLPVLLSRYNSYCAFNIYRSTLDFFQGCWIEQHKFLGYPDSYDYPTFLRRLNGLGQFVGAALFPKDQFDEKALFREITAEFDEERDQMSLVRCYAECEEITIKQAFEKLTKDVIVRSEELLHVFHDKDPRVFDSVKKFMHGFVTWHFSDARYRMHEITALVGDQNDEVVSKFLAYQKHGQELGGVKTSDWAYKTVVEYAAEHKNL